MGISTFMSMIPVRLLSFIVTRHIIGNSLKCNIWVIEESVEIWSIGEVTSNLSNRADIIRLYFLRLLYSNLKSATFSY